MTDQLRQHSDFFLNDKPDQFPMSSYGAQFALQTLAQEQLARHSPNWFSQWSQVHQPSPGCFYSDQTLSRLKDAIQTQSLQKRYAKKLLRWHLMATALLSDFLPNSHKYRNSDQGKLLQHGYKGKTK